VKLVTGTPGGPTIITTITQIVSNIVDFNMDIVNATAAPRLHHQHLPDLLQYERDGMRSDVEAALREMGHDVKARPGYTGDTQSIFVLPDGTLVGVADPRGGGAASGVQQTRQIVR
jgi:gamma-glutamyltranspeptidase/glutathione hydrolase